MRFLFIIFILTCTTAFAQARLPSEIDGTIYRLGNLSVGQRIQVYADAMVVDDDGRCWLNPKSFSVPRGLKGDLEVIHNKLGYIVRVNYKYVQTDKGYSVPRNPNWTRGYAPPFYIPVKSIIVDKPFYGEPSSSDRTSLRMKSPYSPKFSVPKIPSNPY
jgi:hypothetical protein